MKMNLGVALMLIAPFATAGEAVDKTLQVRSDGWVRIDNVRGHIEVAGWEKDEVSVSGTLDDQAERLDFETDGATTTVRVITPEHLKRGDGSNLVIRVPAASRVRVQVVSADLQLTNLRGGVDANSISGEIKASDLAERIELSSVSGDIGLVHSTGAATILHSVSGDIRTDIDTESLDIKTVSGDAHVQLGKPVSAIVSNSVSGDVEIGANLTEAARVRGSSVSGDILLSINRDARAVVDLSATSGGRVTNRMSTDVATRGSGSGREVVFTLGDGKGAIELNTVSGTLGLGPR